MEELLALSLGDPAGIGPELIGEAWAQRSSAALPPFVVTGGAQVLAQAARTRGIDLPVRRVADVQEAAAVFATALPVLGDLDATYHPGQPDEAGARLALQSLEQATALVLSGAASALVTGPIAKAELAKVGFGFPGQTEFVADACGVAAQDAVMMLAGPSLKTVPLTVHCALAQVPGRITADLILRRCRVVAAALQRDFGIEKPRLAIAGLNPHAGENGRMGREEIEIIAPAIARLQAEGIAATGPHPADTLFAPHARGTYDVAIAMYHDQALVPLKTLDFDEGVNMTLGLPIIRTSPDHGTAFDIAGKGIARPASLIAAIRMAAQAAAQRAKWA
ncbi:4-hydroxythreonine-4-phosphate dehydrogenase PdxA [Alteraurantiacibacter aestuarii]|uniref:4-hydroxythreonine-4-phosphate dehydrogenase PdxA n=1 Tax=Alteraurantiacibacter aestuarii TaxID=650004 RepID=UPI0031D305B6